MKNSFISKIILVAIVFLSTTTSLAHNKRLLDDNPYDLEQFYRANNLFDKGQYEDALNIYDNLIAEYPDEAFIRAEKAMTLSAMGRFDEALKIIARVYKEWKDPEVPVYITYAECLLHENELKKAEEVLAQGIEKFPEVGQLHFNMGLLELQREMSKVL